MRGNYFISRMEKQNLAIVEEQLESVFLIHTFYFTWSYDLLPQILAGGKRMYVGGLVGGSRCTLCVCVCVCVCMRTCACVCVYIKYEKVFSLKTVQSKIRG